MKKPVLTATVHRKAFLEQNFYFNKAGSHPAQAKVASQCPHRSPQGATCQNKI